MKERRALANDSNREVKKCMDDMRKCSIRTLDYDTFKKGRDIRLRTFNTRTSYFLSNSKLRRRTRHKLRSNAYFDKVAEKMLREARKLSGDKHITVVIGDPTFGTGQGWKRGGSPWRRIVASIDKIMRRRVEEEGEQWLFVKVNEKWTTRQYVSRSISLTLDQY